MRLTKWLAQNGIASRRTIESWINEGRIAVNGKTAVLGIQVEPKDVIAIDGKRIRFKSNPEQDTRILIYHKPEGEVCSTQGYGKPTPFDNLPPLEHGRWVMVGRLDLNSSGLLLFTNNGELANNLMHPRNVIERQYLVRILGVLSEQAIVRLKEGIPFPEGLAKVKSIELQRGKIGANRWCQVTLTEGKNREVRRLFEAVNCKVSRLIRTRYGQLSLPKELKKGEFLEVSADKVRKISQSLTICAGPKALSLG